MAAPEFVESCAPSKVQGTDAGTISAGKGLRVWDFGERAIQHENHIIMIMED